MNENLSRVFHLSLSDASAKNLIWFGLIFNVDYFQIKVYTFKMIDLKSLVPIFSSFASLDYV